MLMLRDEHPSHCTSKATSGTRGHLVTAIQVGDGTLGRLNRSTQGLAEGSARFLAGVAGDCSPHVGGSIFAEEVSRFP